MVIKRALNIIPFLSVLNSIYLSYNYLEFFTLNKQIKEMANNCMLELFIPIVIISISLIINILRKNKINLKSKKIDIFRTLIIVFTLILVAFSFWLVTYNFLKSNTCKLSVSSFLIFFEVVSIFFSIQKIREKAILKIFGYIAFWAYLAIMCTTVIGVFVKYFGYNELDDSHVQIVFMGVFYHLLNACFLFYSYLPKSLTQWGFKTENLSRKKTTETSDL